MGTSSTFMNAVGNPPLINEIVNSTPHQELTSRSIITNDAFELSNSRH